MKQHFLLFSQRVVCNETCFDFFYILFSCCCCRRRLRRRRCCCLLLVVVLLLCIRESHKCFGSPLNIREIVRLQKQTSKPISCHKLLIFDSTLIFMPNKKQLSETNCRFLWRTTNFMWRFSDIDNINSAN